MRLLMLLAALSLLSCEEEKKTTAQFTVWCKVLDPSGDPQDGQLVAFEAVKVDYDGQVLEDSRASLSKTTASYDLAHPGAASFLVGYTLHQQGDSEESAAFSCTVVVPGSSNDVHSGFEMSYEQAYLAGPVIERALTLQLP